MKVFKIAIILALILSILFEGHCVFIGSSERI